MDGHGEEQL